MNNEQNAPTVPSAQIAANTMLAVANLGAETMYQKSTALDKKIKPLILKWLSKVFKYENYPNSFKDQWITWDIYQDQLGVSFDSRVEEQQKLLSLIPKRLLGCPQYQTLKIVNEEKFYLDVERLGHIKYPKIIKSTLIGKTKHTDNDGDTFYTYDWQVFLDDDSSIHYHNQVEKMDLEYKGFTYNAIIQERFFVRYLALNEAGKGYCLR